MRHQRHTLLVAALAIAVIAVVPGGAVAADGLSVTGDQADDGTVTVTVTENNTSVANATVTVDALNNSSYVGEGTYTTDENGTVELPAPEQNVSVSVTAEANNSTAETTLDLVAPTDDTSGLSVGVTQADDGSATVSVTNGTDAVPNASVSVVALNNSSYAGEGDYTTDENGTVELPAPEENVTVEVTASANNETATTTATLTAATNGSGELTFGERVASFVHQLQAEGNMSGQTVSAFVVSNNPGADNRPDHAGPPHADDDEDDEDDEERGNGNGAEGNDNGNGADGANGNGAGNGNGNGNGNGAGNGNGNGNNGSGNGPGNGNGNGNGGPP